MLGTVGHVAFPATPPISDVTPALPVDEKHLLLIIMQLWDVQPTESSTAAGFCPLRRDTDLTRAPCLNSLQLALPFVQHSVWGRVELLQVVFIFIFLLLFFQYIKDQLTLHVRTVCCLHSGFLFNKIKTHQNYYYCSETKTFVSWTPNYRRDTESMNAAAPSGSV